MTLIRIAEQTGGDYGANAVVSFNDGHPFPITVTDPCTGSDDEKRLEWYYEQHLRFPFTDDVLFKQVAASIAAYGETLFRQVFTQNPKVFVHYSNALQAGLSTLRLEIVGGHRFHALHWEALRDPDLARPLALEATLVRKMQVEQSLPAVLRPSPTLNLLVVTARPNVENDVSYRTITRPLVEALGRAQLRVQIDIVRPGSYKALQHHLEDTRTRHGAGYYHVIHFDLHGALLTYDQLKKGGETSRYLFNTRWGRPDLQTYEGQRAYLFFVDEEAADAEHRSDPVEAAELAHLLQTHQIPIAILNACQSAKQVGERETSLGSRLMQAGMQMVLAMSYSVTVTAAEHLMTTLYTRLFAGNDLAAAIRAARQELHADKGRRAYFGQTIDLEDWLLPVVYQTQDLKLTTREFTREEYKAYYEQLAARYTAQEQTPYKAPLYGFFGRDLDILQIETKLLTRRNLLLIRGMGGAGKTTLLHHLGHWWQTTRFVDRVCYFGYDAQAWTLQQILHSIARQLFADEYDYDTKFKPLASEALQQQLLVEKLRGERHLLILDNLESIRGSALAIRHTLPEAEQQKLRRFLAQLAGGKSLVLLGSRSGEEWLSVATFADNLYDLGGLDPEAASQLAETILERQGTVRYRKEEAFVRLLKLLHGYPLALEVVLSNLTRQTPTEIVAALGAGDVRLDRGDAQDKTESILRCIDYSHRNLSTETQDLLLCLAPFTGVIYTPALKQYTSQLQQQPLLADLPYERWDEVLKEATEWGLLKPMEIPGYLELQPTLPYFLRARLQAPEQAERRAAIQMAFRQYYQRFAATIYQMLESKEDQPKQMGQGLARLEYENLTTALNLALAAHSSMLMPYMALSKYLDIVHEEVRGLQLGETALQLLKNYSVEIFAGQLGLEQVSVIDDIAKRQISLKQYEQAEANCLRLLELLQANHSLDIETREAMRAGIYHKLGIVAQEQRQWEQAEQYYQLALQLFIQFNDRYSQASTYGQLAILAQKQRQWEQAEQYFHQALQFFIEFNDRNEQVRIYGQLGILAQDQRQWEQAEQYFYQALQLSIKINDQYKQANTYHHLGMVAQEKRKWEQAEQYYRQALQLFIEFNDSYNQARIYHQLGMVAQEQRQWEQAEQYYQQALKLYTEYNDRHEQAGTYHQLGKLAQEQEQWEQAEQFSQQALQLFIEFNDLYKQASTYHNLGVVAQGRRQWDQAEQYYQQALTIKIKFNDRYAQFSTYHNLGTVAREQLRWEQATQYYLQALNICIEFKNEHYRDITLFSLAVLWQESGDARLPAVVAERLGVEAAQIEDLFWQILTPDPPAQ
jgi:tetratricopeptide (TPR) repeat protein